MRRCLLPGRVILDVGTGTGEALKHSNHIAKIGIDTDPAAALHVQADARALPFRDNCADTVLLLDVLEHLTDPTPALREAYRTLRTRHTRSLFAGHLLVTVPHGITNWITHRLIARKREHKSFHTARGWARKLKAAGFHLLTRRPVRYFPLPACHFLHATKGDLWTT